MENQEFLKKCEVLLYDYIDPFEVPGALEAIKDALPVAMLGNWIFKKTMNLCQCSECKKLFLPGAQVYNYCPNCGAYMGGTDNET